MEHPNTKGLTITPLRTFTHLIWVPLFILAIGCNERRSEKSVLAHIGERTITVQQYLDRSRFTPRPPYCDSNTEKDKHIILNSLIAEKLLAISANEDSAISQHPRFNALIRGIKEQTMRRLHFEKHALSQVQLSDQQLTPLLTNMRRRYKVQYFIVSQEGFSRAQNLPAQNLKDTLSFSAIAKRFGKVPDLKQTSLLWKDALHPDLFQSLYLEGAEPGTTIGPLTMQDGNMLFMRVHSWMNRLSFSEVEQQFHKSQVKQFLKQHFALQKYQDEIARIMAGKQLVFNKEGLRSFVNLLGPIYFSGNAYYNDFQLRNPKSRWKIESALDSISSEKLPYSETPVLAIDNRQNTIGDLLEEIKYHPLVFRQKTFPKNQFGNQLKLAIVDLMRDHYITREAYEEGLDAHADVQTETRAWSDYFAAIMKKETFIRSGIPTTEEWQLLPDSLFLALKEQTGIQIHVNHSLLDSIKIPEVQTFALQRNAPYPVAVPGFPIVTRSKHLFTKPNSFE